MRKIWLISLILITLLSGCGFSMPQAPLFDPVVPVGSLWKVPVTTSGQPDWSGVSGLAQEQHAGYLLGRQSFNDSKFTDQEASEGSQQDDIQITIRRMTETQRVVAVIGATSNNATMRTASLVNFFNIPMIVPAATGDNLLPSTNVWAFRLSAPGTAYASYMFGTVLKQSSLSGGVSTATPAAGSSTGSAANAVDTRIKVAIVYEQNTFGESAAVATARAALKQEMNIVQYGSFSPENPDQTKLNALIDAVIQEGSQLVYMISNNPDTAKQLLVTIRSRYAQKALPIMVGQAGGFTSNSFLTVSEAEGLFVIRQKLDRSNCPADIDSINEAQNYAAVFLLNLATKEARSLMPRQWWDVFQSKEQETKQLITLREKIRDTLKVTNVNVPCMGTVAFDNSGQNKLLQFELTQIKSGKANIVNIEDFQKILSQK